MVIIDERASVHHWEQSINNVLAVKHYIRSVPAVHDALASATSELLINIRQVCSHGKDCGADGAVLLAGHGHHRRATY